MDDIKALKYSGVTVLLAVLAHMPGIVLAAEPEIELDVIMSVIESEDDAEAKMVSRIEIPKAAVKTTTKSKDKVKSNKGSDISEKAREDGRTFGQQRANEARQKAAAAKEIKEAKKQERREERERERPPRNNDNRPNR